MIAVIAIAAAVLVIAAIDIPPLRRDRHKKELIFWCVFMAIGTGLFTAQVLHAPIPTPLEWLMAVYRPFHEFVDRLLS